jgi:cell division septum initiation protein DivIVA
VIAPIAVPSIADGLDAERGVEMTWVMRDDFPRSRRGWDRDAVREHLRDVETEMQSLATSTRMSGRAAEGVRRVVQAAEDTLAGLAVEAQEELARAAVEAEGIRAAAREEAAEHLREAGIPERAAELEAQAARHAAEEILADARRRASEIVARAESDASARVAEADRAVAGLVAEARAMGERTKAFGAELDRGLGAGGDGAAPAPVNGNGRGRAAGRGRRFEPGGDGGSIPPAAVVAGNGAPAPAPPAAS